MSNKKILAIIPARDGSKRIPGKNYKKFNGEPVIINTIKKLKKSKLFDRIIVSTDSKKIAKTSTKYGAEVPFVRPKLLSNDHISITSVISHTVKFLIKEGYNFDYVCCVYAPNPFLKISDLKKGLSKIRSKKFNYVFSATPFKFPFFRSFTISKNKNIKMLFKKNFNKRSQDLKQIMCDAGQFYWAHKKTWLYKRVIFKKKNDVIMIPKWRYHDIDTKDDWKYAESIHKTLSHKGSK